MADSSGSGTLFNKLQLAEKFCNGNTEKAKKLINGEYKDVIVIKGRFNDINEENYGFFLTFLSRVYYSLFINYFVISNYTVVIQNKPFTEWQLFYSKMEKAMLDQDYDRHRDIEFNQKMKERIVTKNVIKLIELIDTNAIKDLTQTFKELIGEVLIKEVNEIDVDFEETSSLILNEKWKLKPPDNK